MYPQRGGHNAIVVMIKTSILLLKGLKIFSIRLPLIKKRFPPRILIHCLAQQTDPLRVLLSPITIMNDL